MLLVTTIGVTACSAPAPVQEMSNARQTLQAAEHARAQFFAPQQYTKAQVLLEKAAKQLNDGDYHRAKTFAVEARHEANEAHRAALIHQR